MKLTVEEVIEIFNVPEKTIYRWIKTQGLPAYRVHDEYRFNQTDLIEWASAHNVNVSPVQIENSLLHQPDSVQSFYRALALGDIHFHVVGDNKSTILRTIVDLLNLPVRIDRELLLQMLLAREEMGSTALGDGIAIPHPRNPIVLGVPEPVITLCFLEHPIDFGAEDRIPVSIIFMLISPTHQTHLHLLSRLSYFLNDQKFHSAVTTHASREVILNEAQRVERSLSHKAHSETLDR